MPFKLALIATMVLTPALALAGRGDTLVHAQAFCDRPLVGQTFRVGVLFSIEPGWHIYWKNPGDSGLPTKLAFHLPAGWSAGPVQYPLPKKIVLPGDIVNYAYEDKVMLYADVTASTQVADQPISIDASWLVCSDVCLPGKATLALHTGGGDFNTDLFKQWLPQFPANHDAEHIADLKTSSDAKTVTIIVNWKNQAPQDIQFFPSATRGFEINTPTVETKGVETTIHYSATSTAAGSIPIDGLLEYTVSDGRRLGLTLAVRK